MNSGSCLTHGMVLDEQRSCSSTVSRQPNREKTARLLARSRSRNERKQRDQRRVQNFLHNLKIAFKQMFVKSPETHRLDSKKQNVLKTNSSSSKSRSSSFHHSRATTLSGLSLCR